MVSVKYLREVTPYFRKASIISEVGWELQRGFLSGAPPVVKFPQRADTRYLPLQLCHLARNFRYPDPGQYCIFLLKLTVVCVEHTGGFKGPLLNIDPRDWHYSWQLCLHCSKTPILNHSVWTEVISDLTSVSRRTHVQAGNCLFDHKHNFFNPGEFKLHFLSDQPVLCLNSFFPRVS